MFHKKEVTLLNESRVVDTYIIYLFLRKLTKPFTEWKAYDLGIIDHRGNIKIPRKDLKTQEEKNAFTIFDLFVLRMKRILEKLPFGKSRLASYAAALYFIREEKQFNESSYLNDEEILAEELEEFIDYIEDDKDEFMAMIDGLTCKEIEELAANNIGSGHIAGVLDGSRVNRQPPLLKRKKKRDEFGA